MGHCWYPLSGIPHEFSGYHSNPGPAWHLACRTACLLETEVMDSSPGRSSSSTLNGSPCGTKVCGSVSIPLSLAELNLGARADLEGGIGPTF
jgi:hypothetical protein